jgi:protein gp37
MAEQSKIEWTDATWNPWIGCSPVHTGCDHCYARTFGRRFGVTWGPEGTRRVTSQAYWRKPLSWNRKAAAAGKRLKVFPSLCDPFENWDGPMLASDGDELRMCRFCDWWGTLPVIMRQLGPQKKPTDCPECGKETVAVPMNFIRGQFFELIDQTPNLDWILLTKRPENVVWVWPGGPRDNVWLVYSASDQATLDAGIGHLLVCRDLVLVPMLGVSLEPLVGPVKFDADWLSFRCPECLRHGDYCDCDLQGEYPINPTLDWVIVGGETGPGARPMHPDWVRRIRDECKAAGVPFTFKAWGEWAPWGVGGSVSNEVAETARQVGHFDEQGEFLDNTILSSGREIHMARIGKKRAGRLLDGVTWDHWPS